MKKLIRIFEINEYYWIIAKNEEEAITFYENEYEEEVEIIEECNYNDKTYQGLETLKYVFSKDEIEIIKQFFEYQEDGFEIKKDMIKYRFEYFEYGEYEAVLLSFDEIINSPKILKTIDVPSMISSTYF